MPQAPGLSLLRFCNATSEVQASCQLSIDRDFSCHKVRSRNDFVQRYFDVNRFAGAYHAFEFRSVDSRCHGYDPLGWRDFGEQNRTTLQTAFAKDHSWDKWKIRKVSLEEELVGLEGFATVDALFVLCEYFVDQQHRFAVWDYRFNFGLLHQGHGYVSRLNKGVAATPGFTCNYPNRSCVP